MFTRKEESVMIEGFVKLVNYIGEAGINDVDCVSNKEDKPYYINLSREDGEGYSYHYYDYTLYIGANDGRTLEIKTKAIEEPHGNDYHHATKILITYLLPNNKKYGISMMMNGWDYNRLMQLEPKEYMEKARRELDDGTIYANPIPRNLKPFIFKPNEVDLFVDIIEKLIEEEVEFQVQCDNKVNDLLDSLSQNEIKVLKRKLKSGKY